jgi:hypothetical protein
VRSEATLHHVDRVVISNLDAAYRLAGGTSPTGTRPRMWYTTPPSWRLRRARASILEPLASGSSTL